MSNALEFNASALKTLADNLTRAAAEASSRAVVVEAADKSLAYSWRAQSYRLDHAARLLREAAEAAQGILADTLASPSFTPWEVRKGRRCFHVSRPGNVPGFREYVETKTGEARRFVSEKQARNAAYTLNLNAALGIE